MISSDLLSRSEGDLTVLLVFLGFCLIAAISSKAFIRSISDRILQKANEAVRVATETREEIDPLIQRSEESELGADEKKLDPKELADERKKVLAALNHSRFTYRALSGVSKDTEIDKPRVREILSELESEGLAKGLQREKGPRFYVTSKGVEMLRD